MEHYLADLENRIDEAVEQQLLREWNSFLDGNFSGDVFSPCRSRRIPPAIQWPAVRINEALENYQKMLLQQLAGCSTALTDGNGQLLSVRCNYGSSILPSLFGVKLFIMDDEYNCLPTSEPIKDGAAGIRRLIDQGIPDLTGGFGARVFEMGQYFLDALSGYPKMTKYVHIFHPDMQGPMDICEVIWGSGLFLDIVDQPDLVKEFLDLITQTYIAFRKRWTKLFPETTDRSCHWAMLHQGHIMLRDDSAMNFSPDMFAEFIAPYNQRLYREFGGGGDHFCGRGDHYIDQLTALDGLHAVNLSQPEYNDMETIFKHTVDRGIPVIGLQRDSAQEAISRGRNLHGLVHCW